MKNFIKIISFLLILLILVEGTSILLMSCRNIRKYGIYNTSAYDILEEKENSIDVIAIGDSLIYTSINPMQIWNEFGYTVYDCAKPAYIITDMYEYLSYAIKSQKPKIVMMEANVLFRNPKKYAWYKKYIEQITNAIPIYKYHNNWKKFIPYNKSNWINYAKGYKKVTKTKPSKNYNYMEPSEKLRKFPEGNLNVFDKIIKICNENGIKLVLISTPSQVSYNYPRRSTIINLAAEKQVEYIDLNLDNPSGIDWTTDTKDEGAHVNFKGAIKVSHYLGEYLKSSGLLVDHREDPKFSSWHDAYNRAMNDLKPDND